jgi:hypothetical protein
MGKLFQVPLCPASIATTVVATTMRRQVFLRSFSLLSIVWRECVMRPRRNERTKQQQHRTRKCVGHKLEPFLHVGFAVLCASRTFVCSLSCSFGLSTQQQKNKNNVLLAANDQRCHRAAFDCSRGFGRICRVLSLQRRCLCFLYSQCWIAPHRDDASWSVFILRC